MSIHDLEPRYTIREATIKDCDLINSLAWEAFRATYQAILTPEQIEYMMHWMYDEANLRRQMTEEGHVYFIIYVIISNKTPIFRYCVPLVVRVTLQQI